MLKDWQTKGFEGDIGFIIQKKVILERNPMSLETLIKELNPKQNALREALTDGEEIQEAVRLFLELHGILHSKRVAPDSPCSYEDLLLEGLEEDLYRRIPKGEEHSLVWVIWHLSRIEDVTMNLLVAGRGQVFETGEWQNRINSPFKHTLNGTGLEATLELSETVGVSALREYRYAVGRSTREIVQQLDQQDLTRKPAAENLNRIMRERVVIDVGKGVVDYWSSRDVAGLLLMPPTRHTILHWNEARNIIQKLNK
jgi:hypothetical protein